MNQATFFPDWQRRVFLALMLVLAVTGAAQMPIFKRYYVADIPGFGWLAQFYVTLALHYIAAALFLALATYRASVWLMARPRSLRLTGSGALRVALIIAIVFTGFARVAKNLPSWSFDPVTTMLVDWTHLGFAVLLGIAALGAKKIGGGRYVAVRHGEPDLNPNSAGGRPNGP